MLDEFPSFFRGHINKLISGPYLALEIETLSWLPLRPVYYLLNSADISVLLIISLCK